MISLKKTFGQTVILVKRIVLWPILLKEFYQIALVVKKMFVQWPKSLKATFDQTAVLVKRNFGLQKFKVKVNFGLTFHSQKLTLPELMLPLLDQHSDS